MKINVNGKMREMTEAELAEANELRERTEAAEAHRPLTEREITEMFIKAEINNIDIPDQISLRMIGYYPSFDEIIGWTVKLGYKFVYGGKLYKTAQADMTIQVHYPPTVGTESLYTRINEEHLGNKYDPIPYDGNMELHEGSYYTQNGTLYLCVRSTGTAVYHALNELVGLYVEAR